MVEMVVRYGAALTNVPLTIFVPRRQSGSPFTSSILAQLSQLLHLIPSSSALSYSLTHTIAKSSSSIDFLGYLRPLLLVLAGH